MQHQGSGEAASTSEPTTAPAPIFGAWTPSDEWVERRRTTAATYVDLDDSALQSACELAPALGTAVVAAAERAMRHEFALLGSGPFVPVDPDRPARDGYVPIDWYLDPVRQLRFPRGIPYKEWKLYEMRPGNADIKYPWELARCQHWVSLGQAYRLTGDKRFADEIFRQLDDFVEANPVGVGIHWTCTMDVALRAVAWTVAFDLLRRSPGTDTERWRRAYSALFDHGLFIRANLENNYEVTSNHFLSNVAGLWFIAAAFADLPQGQAWAAFARASFEAEIDVQVLPDGADFESSVPYHRFVTELFLGGARLAGYIGQPFSDRYHARIRDMVEYLAAVLRPDGLMPQSGDADDGRLHVLSGAGHISPQDPRHLFGPAARMFGRPEWLDAGGEQAEWEAAWWGLAEPGTEAPEHPGTSAPEYPTVVRLFPDAGHAVVRNARTYLLVTNSIVGTRGFGNHKHNDQLSFEYHAGGVPIVVDPGSFVYTSDPAARNLFRSTAYHNTLGIDGVEQNETNPEWLFRLFEQAHAEHLGFEEGDGWVEYRGRHVGYQRLPEPVVHERRFRLDARSGQLTIDDRLSGHGRHRLSWHFHLAPGVSAHPESGGCRLSAPGASIILRWPPVLAAVVSDAWYSPSYGARTACRALDLTTDADVDTDSEWCFTFTPEDPV